MFEEIDDFAAQVQDIGRAVESAIHGVKEVRESESKLLFRLESVEEEIAELRAGFDECARTFYRRGQRAW